MIKQVSLWKSFFVWLLLDKIITVSSFASIVVIVQNVPASWKISLGLITYILTITFVKIWMFLYFLLDYDLFKLREVFNK